MKVLADHRVYWLQNIDIRGEAQWFKNDRDECMSPLLALLAMQTDLKEFFMFANKLSHTQKSLIHNVIAENAPECELKGEIDAKSAQKNSTCCGCFIF